MTRRRLILAVVAGVLCGMAWWLSLDRLSAEERLLVGTLAFDGKPGTGNTKMRFAPSCTALSAKGTARFGIVGP